MGRLVIAWTGVIVMEKCQILDIFWRERTLHKGEDHRKAEAGIRVVPPQSKEC